MAIIVSRNGKNAVKIEKSKFKLEDRLQQYIYDNPETIPLYDIKEDIRLLILAREFSTKSGPIDALGVDKDGEIYLIETKLYKNPDKRTVVAQVLDYGASLWSNYRDFADFIEQVGIHTSKDFSQTLNQRLADFFGISEDETDSLLESTRRNLSDGNFKFVVLMDHLHPQLKDLIIFLNNNSEFTVYAVELEFYQHQDFEILIPKLYGAEVKKDLGKAALTKIIPSDEEFVNAYQGRPEITKVQELIDLKNSIKDNPDDYPNIAALKTPKYLNFYVLTSFEDKISVCLHINPESEGGGLQIWVTVKNQKATQDLLGKKIITYEPIAYSGKQFGKVARVKLETLSINAFGQFLKELAKI